jgi:hypothetical protein
VRKRFATKKANAVDPARRTPALQSRVQVLNDDLRLTVCGWFPGMKTVEQTTLKNAA